MADQQGGNVRIRGWVFGLIVFVLLLKLAGFIGSFWTGLGFVSLVALLVLLQKQGVTKKWVDVVFVGWAVAYVALPMIRGSIFPNQEVLNAQIELRKDEVELWWSEITRPTAQAARKGWLRYCHQIEDIQGSWIQQRLRESDSVYARDLQTESSAEIDRFPETLLADSSFVAMMDTIVAHREKCRGLVLGNDKAEDNEVAGTGWWQRLSESLSNTNNPIPRLAFWAIGLFVALVIAGALRGKKRLVSAATALAALVVAMFFADSALYGGPQYARAAASRSFVPDIRLARDVVAGMNCGEYAATISIDDALEDTPPPSTFGTHLVTWTGEWAYEPLANLVWPDSVDHVYLRVVKTGGHLDVNGQGNLSGHPYVDVDRSINWARSYWCPNLQYPFPRIQEYLGPVGSGLAKDINDPSRGTWPFDEFSGEIPWIEVFRGENPKLVFVNPHVADGRLHGLELEITIAPSLP